jgi:hypothetical protein
MVSKSTPVPVSGTSIVSDASGRAGGGEEEERGGGGVCVAEVPRPGVGGGAARARRGLARDRVCGQLGRRGRGGSGLAGREFFPERAARVQSGGAQRSAVAMCGRMVVVVSGDSMVVPKNETVRHFFVY